MLKAVILAGGLGTRLRQLTVDMPKPMIKINGRPFLCHQLELLKKNSVEDILICVGYLKEKIVNYFGNGSKIGLRIEYSIEEDFLGTGGALRLAHEKLPNEFLLLYGDSYLPIDYKTLVDYWRKADFAGLVVAYDNKAKIAENNVCLDKDNLVREYCKQKPSKKMNYVEAGVIVFKKESIDLIPPDQEISLEETIFPALIEKDRLGGYPTGQRFYDIGTPEGLRDMGNMFK